MKSLRMPGSIPGLTALLEATPALGSLLFEFVCSDSKAKPDHEAG